MPIMKKQHHKLGYTSTSFKFVLDSISLLFKITEVSSIQKPHTGFQKMYTGNSIKGGFDSLCKLSNM